MKLQNKILLIIVLMLTVATAKAQCGFTVSASSVCAGDEVVVKLDTPYAKYHNIVVYKGTFPFGNVANSPIDYEVVAPYMLTENEVRLVFNGASTAQNYTIVLTRSNSNPNPIFPSDACGNTRQITVNPSPDASMSETRNFLYCTVSGNQTISVTNTSRTTAQNTNYTIDWGDGSPAFNSATFTNTTHSYAPGNYVLTYTVTGSFAAPCNRSVKKIPVVIKATAPNYKINSAPTSLCAPALYEQNINTAVTALNSPDTYYKYYVNGE
ncbi:MAG TPA: PKD domain-containing protein, partial [Chitinophagales bacterium]|nr:PKD domain-containing protein [Chitinophagales bacterium]